MQTSPAVERQSGTEWMERIRQGDEAAFEELFRSHAPGLCAYVARLIRSREAAEDLVQDLFLRVWDQRRDLQVTGSISGYLFRAAKHRALDHIRHDKVVDRFAAAAARVDDSPSSGESELLALLELHDAISQLPIRRRLIFTLSRQQGMTNSAIAESLGLSIKTVEAQISSALKTLRAVVG